MQICKESIKSEVIAELKFRVSPQSKFFVILRYQKDSETGFRACRKRGSEKFWFAGEKQDS